jgi:hypothetical protein
MSDYRVTELLCAAKGREVRLRLKDGMVSCDVMTDGVAPKVLYSVGRTIEEGVDCAHQTAVERVCLDAISSMPSSPKPAPMIPDMPVSCATFSRIESGDRLIELEFEGVVGEKPKVGQQFHFCCAIDNHRLEGKKLLTVARLERVVDRPAAGRRFLVLLEDPK